jgi:XTP/dITP diphosphohydrolase
MRLVCASANPKKVAEIARMLPQWVQLLPRPEHVGDVEENAPTLEGNAIIKAVEIANAAEEWAIADDTGLEVIALGGAPGVRSARYAHDNATDQENIDKLLDAMNTFADRTACFKTVISLQFEGGEYFFEGECSGQILPQQRGSAGFGYDPIFVPDGSTHSFAEMSSAEKNRFSHREKAVRKMLSFLQYRISLAKFEL